MDIEWTNELATGVEEIDDQHRKLIDKINTLLISIGQGQKKGKEVLLDTLAFLENYAQVHFQTEENYMKRSKYPEYRKHVKEHHEFIKDLNGIKERIINHTKPTYLGLQSDMGYKMYTWITNHIGKTDKNMGTYLLERWKNR